MTEIALVLVVIALLVERFFSQKAHYSQLRRLLNLVESRTPQEFAMLNRVDDLPQREPKPEREPIYPVGA